MKPNCMICKNFLKIDCPLFNPFNYYKSNNPFSWNCISEFIQSTGVVCDIYKYDYEQTIDKEGGEE